jgi:hypothetical protein
MLAQPDADTGNNNVTPRAYRLLGVSREMALLPGIERDDRRRTTTWRRLALPAPAWSSPAAA